MSCFRITCGLFEGICKLAQVLCQIESFRNILFGPPQHRAVALHAEQNHLGHKRVLEHPARKPTWWVPSSFGIHIFRLALFFTYREGTVKQFDDVLALVDAR